jgi:peptidase A4-like protein
LAHETDLAAAAERPQTTSPNWSGWADVASPGAAMRSVTAAFRVPFVRCAAYGRSVSIWAGLDGIGDAAVELAGVEGICVRTRHGRLAAQYVSATGCH